MKFRGLSRFCIKTDTTINLHNEFEKKCDFTGIYEITMENFRRRALKNIIRYGDTDIFPFPVENLVLAGKTDAALSIMNDLDADIAASLAQSPPSNVGALAPAGYTGFRWAIQIDPIWNALYLSWVLSIAEKIEAARVPVIKEQVYSYRYQWDDITDSCFDRSISWRKFIQKAIEKAGTKAYVVSCDISEFYLRINHHRIENTILHLPNAHYASSRIMPFLSNISNTYSFGLPVGGPASRLISELVLAQIDRLLIDNYVDFVRYADDYYLFTDSPDESFKSLVTLTNLLIANQGLQLQKSKTRIMSSAEFIASNPLVHDEEDAEAPIGAARQALMSINVHYDPYSPTAANDYELLKVELDKYPVMDIIRAELKKSRVDVTLAKRLISVTKYLEGALLNDAIKTLIENHDILYPVYHNVLMCGKEIFDRLTEQTKNSITSHVRELIENKSRVMVLDLTLQYAVRLLSLNQNEDSRLLFTKLFRNTESASIKRDIILALARWGDWFWLSDQRHRFRNMSDQERRAFIVASYRLKDEGRHWRDHLSREFSPTETLIKSWAGERFNHPRWQIPL